MGSKDSSAPSASPFSGLSPVHHVTLKGRKSEAVIANSLIAIHSAIVSNCYLTRAILLCETQLPAEDRSLQNEKEYMQKTKKQKQKNKYLPFAHVFSNHQTVFV